MMDELPPFNIEITLANEFGDTSRISIVGVEFTEGNRVMSVEDMQTNEQYSFVAQSIIG